MYKVDYVVNKRILQWKRLTSVICHVWKEEDKEKEAKGGKERVEEKGREEEKGKKTTSIPFMYQSFHVYFQTTTKINSSVTGILKKIK